MSNLFKNIISLKDQNYIKHIVTPITPYLLCNHFVSTEIHKSSKKYVHYKLDIKANDLLKNKNYNNIKNYDIVQVQVDHFDFFYDKILPIIVKNKIKIILITSQYHLPQLNRNNKTDNCVNHENILLWVSQNPIYPLTYEKYLAFPYGIHHNNLEQYMNYVKLNNKINKNIEILNQNSSTHKHLPANHIRKVYNIFGTNSGPRINYLQFLQNIEGAKFVISTAGDRDDCYRHYECIGLNAIPVSNIGGDYVNIFGNNMIYSNATEMIEMINEKTVKYEYVEPNRDIITVQYWVEKMNEKIDKIKLNK